MRPRIGFSARRDVFMAGQSGDGITLEQCFGQVRQRAILNIFKRPEVAALDFDTDRKVVSSLPAVVDRDAGMPGAVVGRDELDDSAVAADQKMRGHAQCAELIEIRMGIVIEPVCE